MDAHPGPEAFRAVWRAKPVLREVYGDYYRRIEARRVPGPTVEIGAGSGNLRDVLPDIVATDVVASRWIDAAADAHALPFGDGALGNLVGVDVLHHLEFPAKFLAEAQRVLAPGGRVVVVEPAITPVSRVFYTRFHPELVDMRVDPLVAAPADPGRRPLDANQAVPTLLAGRPAGLAAVVPELRLVEVDHLSLLAYPLSGGFRPWSLVPTRWVPRLVRVEQALPAALRRVMAFRLLMVLERVPDRASSSFAGIRKRTRLGP